MGISKIKFKRKAKSGPPTNSEDRKLEAGEPFYNTFDKHLYVGNGDDAIDAEKKHIAQVTVTDASEAESVKVSVGEDDNNFVGFNKDTFTSDGNKISLDLTEVVLDGGAADAETQD